MSVNKNIFIKNIYYMLAYAFQELQRNQYEDIQSEDFDEIHQLLAEILIHGVSFQLKKGLHKEYISKTESIASVKGKIDIPGTVQHLMQRKMRISCQYDELSENCLFNQIIKTTCEILLSHPSVKTSQKFTIKRLMLFFSEVNEIPPLSIKWNLLRYDRNSRTYQMLHYICFFIIDNMILTSQEGKFKMSRFSDEHMCRLYEKFVLEYYRKEHPETKARAAQIKWNIDELLSTTDILPILQTDIYLTLKDRTLIIDTKYYSQTMQEHFDKVSIHSANLNQILVYVLNEDDNMQGKVDGMLLYAKTDEDIVPDGQLKWKTGSTIYFRTLDLGVDFKYIRKQLDDFLITKS